MLRYAVRCSLLLKLMMKLLFDCEFALSLYVYTNEPMRTLTLEIVKSNFVNFQIAHYIKLYVYTVYIHVFIYISDITDAIQSQ